MPLPAAERSSLKRLGGVSKGVRPLSGSWQGLPVPSPSPDIHTPQLSQGKGRQTSCPAANVAVHGPVTQSQGRDWPAAHPYSQRAAQERGGARRKGTDPSSACVPIGRSLSRLCAGPGRKGEGPASFPSFRREFQDLIPEVVLEIKNKD